MKGLCQDSAGAIRDPCGVSRVSLLPSADLNLPLWVVTRLGCRVKGFMFTLRVQVPNNEVLGFSVIAITVST